MCALLSKTRGRKLAILKFDSGGGQGAPKISDHSQITHFPHSRATTFMDFGEICFVGSKNLSATCKYAVCVN